jgi:hypothetical protein
MKKLKIRQSSKTPRSNSQNSSPATFKKERSSLHKHSVLNEVAMNEASFITATNSNEMSKTQAAQQDETVLTK